MTDSLPNNVKFYIALEACIQSIPYVGSALAVIYFGSKQEKRIQRIESFYQELAQDLESIKGSIKPITEQDPEALEAIIDALHDKIEIEPTTKKIEYFKNYYKSTLKDPVCNNYDQRKYFLESLHEMSILECNILSLISIEEGLMKVGDIYSKDIDQYAIVGAVNRLKSRGFIKAYQTNYIMNGTIDSSLLESIEISPYGKNFYSFCLED